MPDVHPSYGGHGCEREGAPCAANRGGRQAYLGLVRKLMTLFSAQMDALNRHRGKATVQKVIVERVQVAPGAQAVPEGCWSSGGMRLSSTQRSRLGIVSYHKKVS